MKNKEFKEILKKCFGKEKDTRYHAIAMLAIYGIFMIVLIVMIRIGGTTASNSLNNNDTSNVPSDSTVTEDSSDNSQENNGQNNTVGSDVNYSYSYTVSYNGISEVYLGKKLDDKEKFTLIKDGITTNYGILNDNYLILQDDGNYHISESPSKFFKYCDVDRIIALIENQIPTENGSTIKYSVSNKDLKSIYKDEISIDNEQSNLIQMHTVDGVLKGMDIDFSNYYSSIQGTTVTLTIHMEFADVGTTEDFELNIAQ